ncbi:putative undecaprenyl-phosphate N-acetylglucosaminyl 1-phosphate transferase [Moorella humiferrea]|uniref:Putative undecaprenyl-phosphate N-acetylglucosaminyl 1-phosphate transferase n=1 Tax=Neomoorella humiferrea TaxID=676965 RepID=A0A2T0ASF6_9FIRM|nr:MraY family glycosyltransferase [Moorella humiferrea]PRR73137.1 putative undecaprenyl-phosphate N-acetylglucosaminyl 1-phosphate transferase [Moorella humiferrea]
MHVLALILAGAVSFGLTPLLCRLAPRLGAVDKPDARKIHRGLMPRLGGVAIYAGFVAAFCFLGYRESEYTGLFLGGTLIMLVGLVDDIKNISPRLKLLGQIAAAALLVAFGVRVEFLTNPFDGLLMLGKLAVPVTIFWIVGVTNALNLVDGLDGLAAGTSFIAAVTIAVVAWLNGEGEVALLSLALAASVLGFLPFNFHPARTFMGDCGSMFLGFNLASLAVIGLTKSATVISLFIPVVILGLPILDTFLAIVRRLYNHRPIFAPDKGHLHHCLLAQGLTQRQAVAVIYLVNACLGASAVLLTRLTTDQGVLILVGLAVLILLGCDRLGVLGKRRVPRIKTRHNSLPML